jgi:uncharacterized protein
MTAYAAPSARPVIIRVALFWLAYLTVLAIVGLFKGMLPPSVPRDLAWGGVSTVILVGMTRFFERRASSRSGDSTIVFNRGTLPRFALGVAVGSSVLAFNIAILRLVVGPIRVVVNEPSALATSLVVMIATFIALSCMEELGFRGYPLRELIPAIGFWRAQAIVAIAFGLSHIIYGWAPSTVLLGVIPSALLFGIAASVSGGLAMPVGVHAALNMALWSVGAKTGHGIWTVVVPPDLQPRVDALSPYLGAGSVVGLALLLWILRPRRGSRDDRVATSQSSVPSTT